MGKMTNLLGFLEPELADQVLDRRSLLRRGVSAKTIAALASVPTGLALMANRAFAQGGLPQDIVDVLNFALTLEYLEAEFYTLGVAESGLIPSGDADVFTAIRDHENAHVALLRSVLGSQAVDKPEFDFTAGGAFPDAFSNYDTFLLLSQAFEDTGVRAYKGQAAALMSNDDILTTALQIHSVEARHAGEVRRIRGSNVWIEYGRAPIAAVAAVYEGEDNLVHAGVNATATTTEVDVEGLTEAFDEPLTMAQVLAIADPFIV